MSYSDADSVSSRSRTFTRLDCHWHSSSWPCFLREPEYRGPGPEHSWASFLCEGAYCGPEPQSSRASPLTGTGYCGHQSCRTRFLPETGLSWTRVKTELGPVGATAGHTHSPAGPCFHSWDQATAEHPAGPSSQIIVDQATSFPLGMDRVADSTGPPALGGGCYCESQVICTSLLPRAGHSALILLKIASASPRNQGVDGFYYHRIIWNSIEHIQLHSRCSWHSICMF